MFTRRIRLTFMSCLLICAAQNAWAEQHWGDFKKDGCIKPGIRQYSSILWDVPRGTSFLDACHAASATIGDAFVGLPSRCREQFGGFMWGEFEVPDATCSPPSPASAADRSAESAKQICLARCDNSPVAQSLNGAQLNDQDHTGDRAAIAVLACHGACEAGILTVPDLTTMRWNEELAVPKGCVEAAYRIYDIPCTDAKGHWALQDSQCKTLETFKGQPLPDKASPINSGLNTFAWSTFKFPDDTCKVHWGDFKADQCTVTGRRQYSAILWGIPDGWSWLDTCNKTSALVKGENFAKPSRCKEAGGHVWGEFDVADSTCGALPASSPAAPKPVPPVAAIPPIPAPSRPAPVGMTGMVPNPMLHSTPNPTPRPTPIPTAAPASAPTAAPTRASTRVPSSAPAPAVKPASSCNLETENRCKSLLQDFVPWTKSHADDPAYRHWNEGNLVKLCACSPDAAKTVRCFQDELASNGDSFAKAIDVCRAR